MSKNYIGKPLCVDLDGTIIASDSLAESLLVLIKTNPLMLFMVPFWIVQGKYYFKEQLEKHSKISPEMMLYREKVLQYIIEEKKSGRKIVLATASMPKIAKNIADYLGIFDEVLASEDNVNLRAENKRDKLIELYGKKGFDYIGDSKADLPVWEAADKAILVHPKKRILKKAEKAGNVKLVFKHNYSKLKAVIKQIRLYQWIKNILIFVPFLLAHKLISLPNLNNLLLGFVSFGLLASFVYVLNDLLDIEADRHHPTKKNRPIASGRITIVEGFMMIPFLFVSSFVISILYLPFTFTLILILYLVSNILYSFYLKKVMIMDIIMLSGLFTVRLIAGSVLANISFSAWLVEFSIFFFFSLATIKRYSELLALKDTNKTSIKRRGYKVSDIDMIRNFGIISGYLSVLIIALYVNSNEVIRLYSRPELLWIISPILLLWISRIWLIAHRGELNEDPIVFTVKDPVSWVIGIISVIIIIGAAL